MPFPWSAGDEVLATELNAYTPIGVVSMFAGSSAPTGWVLCDGASLLRAGTYAALFAVLGTTFGAADGTHFNVPDMRGRTPVGSGTGAGGGASGSASAPTGGSALTARALGDWLGEETVPHTHNITFSGHGFVVDNGADSPRVTDGTYTTASAAPSNIQPVTTLNFIIKYL